MRAESILIAYIKAMSSSEHLLAVWYVPYVGLCSKNCAKPAHLGLGRLYGSEAIIRPSHNDAPVVYTGLASLTPNRGDALMDANWSTFSTECCFQSSSRACGTSRHRKRFSVRPSCGGTRAHAALSYLSNENMRYVGRVEVGDPFTGFSCFDAAAVKNYLTNSPPARYKSVLVGMKWSDGNAVMGHIVLAFYDTLLEQVVVTDPANYNDKTKAQMAQYQKSFKNLFQCKKNVLITLCSQRADECEAYAILCGGMVAADICKEPRAINTLLHCGTQPFLDALDKVVGGITDRCAQFSAGCFNSFDEFKRRAKTKFSYANACALDARFDEDNGRDAVKHFKTLVEQNQTLFA